MLRGINKRMLSLKAKLGTYWSMVLGMAFSIFVLIIGICGFMFIEKWGFIDAFYMVIITLSTVGFMEVHPLSQGGRIFASILIMGGVGSFLYIAAAFSQVLVEGRLQLILGRRRMMKEISRMEEHFIVCGYGRIGSIVVKEVQEEGHQAVVIENNPDLIAQMEEEGILCIEGDATSDEVLMSAGLMSARSLITALSNEAANVYVTLTARQLNPKLTIVARAGDKSHISRLELAGADRVVLPHFIGGIRMAQSVLRPTVTNFMDIAARGGLDLQMEELVVSPESELVNKDLIQSQIRPNYNLIVIAIKKSNDDMVFNPGPKEVIHVHDTLLAVGMKSNLEAIKEIL